MKGTQFRHLIIPESNGLRGVAKLTDGTVLSKIAKFLFNHRSTPQSTPGMSPSELLLERGLNSVLNLM